LAVITTTSQLKVEEGKYFCEVTAMFNDWEWYRNQNHSIHRLISNLRKNTAPLGGDWDLDCEQSSSQIM
jgi:hypothetical protein